MTVNLSLLGGAGWQFSDNNGSPLSGGLLYTYQAGTTTPQATYTSNTGVTAQTNPIVLDSAGRIAGGEIWLTQGQDYKFVLKTSAGASIGTYDNVPGANDLTALNTFEAALAAPTGSSLVGFIQSGTGAVATTVQTKLRESVSVKDFGAVGDGVADDTAAIQAAIDWAIYTGRVQRVYIPSGRYKTTTTIFLGYGTNSPQQYASITFEGDGSGYRGESQFGASVLLPTFEDRPAIAVQGGRSTRISRICVLGTTRSFIQTFGPGVTGNIRDINNWVKPGTTNGRFNVYCGIAVDPYAGPAPAQGYPTVNYPAIVGGSSVPQYNKAYSSDVLISECYIIGFNVGLAVQPCDADGNGDFVRCDHTVFEYLAVGVAVGNTQSRLVRLSYCQLTQLHTAINNVSYGQGGSVGQAGTLQSHIDSCEFRSATQILDIDANLSAPLVFTACYSEDLWRLGNANGSSRAASLMFNGCQFSFNWQSTNPNFGIPQYTLLTGQAQASIIFNACRLTSFYSVIRITGAAVVSTLGTEIWLPDPDTIGSSSITNKSCLNYTLGIVVDAGFPTIKTDIRWDLDTGASVGGTNQIIRGGFETGARAIPYSKYCQTSVVGNEIFNVLQNSFISDLDPVTGIVATLVDRTLTLTKATFTAFTTFQSGGRKGDLLLIGSNVFFITNYLGTTITAELMNNYTISGGVVSYITAFSITNGNVVMFNTRNYSAPGKVTATVSNTSRVLTSVTREDGTTPIVQPLVLEGDQIYSSDQNNRLFVSGPGISPRITTTGTINSGSPTLTVGVASIGNGFPIVVTGAGAAGADLSTTVVSGGGTTTLTLSDNASTSVVGATVTAGGLVKGGFIVVDVNPTRTETASPIRQFIRQPVA